MPEDEIHSDGAGSVGSGMKRKSMGLSSAKKALKKLFRLQPSPADDSCPTVNSRVDQLDTLATEGTSKQENISQANSAKHEQPNNGLKTRTETARGSQIKTLHDSAPKSNIIEPAKETISHSDTLQKDTSAMNALQPHQQQPRPKVKLPGAAFKPDQEEKENLYPDQLTKEDLIQLEDLNIGRHDKDGLSPEEQLAELMKDPVIAAQRAEHMRFMGEALDMVWGLP